MDRTTGSPRGGLPPAHRTRVLRRRGDERGASLVEFALLLPVFMILLLGMLSGGLAYNQRLDVSHATRDGARYGATVPTNQSWVSGTWAQNVRTVVVQRSAGDLVAGGATTSGLTTDGVCVALVSGPANNPSAIGPNYTTATGTNPCFVDDANDTTDRGTRIQVAARRAYKVEAFLFSFTTHTTFKAIGRYESK